MKFKSAREIEEFLTPYALKTGVKIYEIRQKHGNSPELEIVIEKEGGVDLDACAAFHNAILDDIDLLDPTFGAAYTLNVSSKGIDWAFKTEEDFVSHIGKKVEVKLKNSVRGKKAYDGYLLSYDGKTATLKVDEKTTFTIDLKNLAKMNEYIDFE